MGKTFGIVVLLFLAALGVYFFGPKAKILQNQEKAEISITPVISPEDLEKEPERVEVFAKNLEVPWSMVFLPDGNLLLTERKGKIKLISKNGDVKEIGEIQGVKQISESGLHGITLHPDFQNNNFIYLYYTYGEDIGQTLNRVVRMEFDGSKLSSEKIIVDNIPGAPNHDGGRIKFGPDRFLYITTGDAQEPSRSQDKNSLAGKILRVSGDGSPVSGNPFGNRIYSLGHRNPQGITWDNTGQLWEVEHGPSGGSLGFGNDEVNKIEPGKNYGWPEIQGNQTKSGMEAPVLNSGSDTWAPAGVSYLNGSLFFGGLRGQALYKAIISDEGVVTLETYLKNEFGRIRDVIVGPDNMLYISTSNKDGRGFPKNEDDKILRVNPAKL